MVLFTHIEDNTPAGTLGTAAARANYLLLRDRLIKMAELARRYSMAWVLQPDWKFLEAALLYEDAAAMASTGGKCRYQRQPGFVDPHRMKRGGQLYRRRYLLEQLGGGQQSSAGIFGIHRCRSFPIGSASARRCPASAILRPHGAETSSWGQEPPITPTTPS
jgi:hypothetical protein